jgi:dolichyl-phosphate-mannose-protein mannosyltransferase
MVIRMSKKAKRRRAIDKRIATPTLPAASYRWEARAGALFALLAFCVYAATAHRGLAGGDTGELIVVSRTLGVAHPPGYPLFTLLGHLFSWLPFGSVASRVNLVSSCCDAAAAGLLLYSCARWTRNLWCGVAAAGLFAFSPSVWSYAGVAEVFPLNNFFAAGLFAFALALESRPTVTRACWAAFWTGLGLTNHQTLIFFAAPFWAWILWRGRGRLLKAGPLLQLGACLAAGLAPYLYLLAAAQKTPIMGWGDTSTLSGLKSHILRADYGTFRLGSEQTGDEGTIVRRIWIYLRQLPAQFAYVGLAATVFGFYATLRRGARSAYAVLWAVALGCYVVPFQWLNNVRLDRPLAVAVQSRFNQMPNLVLCLFTAAGLAALLTRLEQRRAGSARILAPGIAAALLAFQLGANWRAQDQRYNRVIDDFGKQVLANLPPNAVLLTQGDHIIGVLRYLQLVDGLRPDVSVLDEALLAFTWSPRWVHTNFADVVLPKNGVYSPGGYMMKDFFDANSGRRPLFVVNGLKSWDNSVGNDYQFWPVGFSTMIVPTNTEPDLTRWAEANRQTFSEFDWQTAQRYASGSWEALVREQYWRGLQHFAMQTLTLAVRDPAAHREQLVDAINWLKMATENNPNPDPRLFKNLGIAYQQLAPFDSTAVEPMVTAWRKYLALVSPGAPDTAAVKAALTEAERRLGSAAAE